MKNKKFSPRIFLTLLIFIFGVPLLPLLISCDWNGWEVWAYDMVSIPGFAVSRYLASREHPDLLVERGKFLQYQNPEPWDKILSPLMGLGGGLSPLVARLHTRLGSFISFPLLIQMGALTVIISGDALGAYVLIANRYFSDMVRIQSDPGHQVVKSCPYQWMRHPEYTGVLLIYLATPFLLESLWTFVPMGFILIILFIHTALEGRVLQVKLEGYREFTDAMRYHLVISNLIPFCVKISIRSLVCMSLDASAR